MIARAFGVGTGLAIVVAATAWAGERRLAEAEIVECLTGALVAYDGARQRFHESGLTEYWTDRRSEGRWAARAGQYCSVWPPSDLWSCYDVYEDDADPAVLIWIGSDRSRSVGRIVDEDGE